MCKTCFVISSSSLLAQLFPSVAYMSEREMDYPLTGYEVVDRVLHSDRYGVSVMVGCACILRLQGSLPFNLLSQPH